MTEYSYATGVYKITHKPSGFCYIGSSIYSIEGRWGVHRNRLRCATHHCVPFQELWSATTEKDWVFSVIELCPIELCRAREDTHLKSYPAELLLNRTQNVDNAGIRHTEISKQRMRAGIAAKFRDHAQRESRSERLRQAHRDGKLGKATWKNSPAGVKGEANVRAKLTESDVRFIRISHAEGLQTIQELCDIFGMSISGIGHVIRRLNWRHVA